MDLALEQKLIVRSGAWFRYGEVHLGQGREKARQFLKDDPKVAQELHRLILAEGGFGDSLEVPAEEKNGEESETK